MCAVLVLASRHTARAAGVVGTGTAASCTDAALNAVLAGGGLVTFNCGGPATINISTGTGTKTISADTTVDGGGLITISGGDSVRVFSVPVSVQFTVHNLRIAAGHSENGGGILNNGGGALTVTNSTFTSNSAGAGGAILGLRGSVIVTNSTFTDNSADTGGGIVSSTLTVTSSTFTGNSGGGISSGASGSAALRNTLLANSPSGGNCIGSIDDGGHNLDDGTSCGFSTARGSLSGTNPQLDPVGPQNNGGPTQTVALCTGAGMPAGCTAASPAIDAGDQAVCAAAPVNNLDQRGFVRPGTGHAKCSIGAYEADATGPEACTGDCDGTRSVTVDELITLGNIALGNAQASACPRGVPSGAEVDIALIIQAVNNALTGCGGS